MSRLLVQLLAVGLVALLQLSVCLPSSGEAASGGADGASLTFEEELDDETLAEEAVLPLAAERSVGRWRVEEHAPEAVHREPEVRPPAGC